MNALILCNGEAPAKLLFEQILQWSDLFIAADGGGNIARSLGTLPDLVIGDLDSFEKKDNEALTVVHKPSQYANDLEKALQYVIGRGAKKVKVLGATGQRLDHTLKNLSVLKQFNDSFQDLLFIDDFGTTRLLPRKYSVKLPLQTSISLFPLSGKVTGITTKGLKYPLNDGFLENGVQDGSSNTVVSNPVQISHTKGDLLMFIAK